MSSSRKLSQRAINCAPSPTLGIAAKANALKAEGKDVLSFSAGEPDFDTPENVKAAAVKALEQGQTKYTPSSGTPALKNAIIAKLQRDNGLTYKPNEIIASAGAKHSIYNLMQAILEEGDEVLIPAPYWVSYPEQVKLADATPVIIPTGPDFLTSAEDVEKYVTPKTKLLVLNSPSNPTGAVYTEAQLRAIAEVAVKHGFYILSDEIYEKIIFSPNKFVSIASFSPEVKALTITINGLSKSHSMTGWRIGYAAADAEIVAAMGRIQDQSTSNPTSITQAASVEALNGPQDAVETMRVEFEKRRTIIVDGLNAIPGIECPTPGGAFYVFPKVSGLYGKSYTAGDGSTKTIKGSDDFAAWLLDVALVALVPGSGFGADEYVRLSYATSAANITKGLDRIATAVEALR
ncbi:MAG TPA: pyridoxal phosphate-dependent aminotransferase [Capsulimonadaceae bacterium]